MRILNKEDLTNHGNTKGRELLFEIMEAGMSAGNPYTNVRRLLTLKDNILTFSWPSMEPAGDPRSGPAVYDLSEIDRVFVFGIGKGIQDICKAVEDVLGDRLTGGLVIGKHGDGLKMERVEAILGGHPVPDEFGVAACQKMYDMITTTKFTERDLVITATGNGCGSLCTLPAEGISLEDIKDYTYMCQIELGMLTSELTQIRNQIDRMRGGRMLRHFHPAKMVHLLGVAPGAQKGNLNGYRQLTEANNWLPMLADSTTPESALEVIRHYDIMERLPKSISSKLKSLEGKPNDTLTCKEFLAMDCRIFSAMPLDLNTVNIAMEKAKELGFETHYLTNFTFTEATDTGQLMAYIALNVANNERPFKAPCAIFCTGEVITTVGKETGIGGTNQEYCLSAALTLKGNTRVVMAAVDTDGNDGPGGDFHPDATARGITVLSGGMVDGYTAIEAAEKGVDIHEALKQHNTSQACWRLGAGIAAQASIRDSDLHCMLILPKE